MTDWTTLPKVELHVHLEGAMPPDLARAFAAEQGLDTGEIFDARGTYCFTGFPDFLRVYEAATAALTSPARYARLTGAVLDRAAADGVIYTEMFLSPDFCGGGDVAAWRDHLAAIAEAARAAEARHGIVMRGCVTAIRHFGPDRARRIAECAAATAGDFVTGFGLAGNEAMFAPADFAPAFDAARAAGLGITAHAGEWAGPDAVAATLDALRPSRIGHGVAAARDPALTARLAAEGVVLEVCPGSNVALGLFPDFARHPVAALRAAGVPVTLSTDDPPFFHTTLSAEYAALSAAFGWGPEEFAEMNRIAADAAFCDETARAGVRARLGGHA